MTESWNLGIVLLVFENKSWFDKGFLKLIKNFQITQKNIKKLVDKKVPRWYIDWVAELKNNSENYLKKVVDKRNIKCYTLEVVNATQ